MTKEILEKEFEIRELKTLSSKLNMKLKKAEQQLNARTIKEVKDVEDKYKKEVKELKRQLAIKEDLEQRLEKKLESQELESEKIINEKDAEIFA